MWGSCLREVTNKVSKNKESDQVLRLKEKNRQLQGKFSLLSNHFIIDQVEKLKAQLIQAQTSNMDISRMPTIQQNPFANTKETEATNITKPHQRTSHTSHTQFNLSAHSWNSNDNN